MAEHDPLPDVLTIEEAARVLRVGRTAAYEQARVWRETQGQAGLPNFRMGDALRVPAAALEKMLGRPLSSIPPPRRRKPSGRELAPTPPASEGQVRELRQRLASRRRSSPGGAQGALPL